LKDIFQPSQLDAREFFSKRQAGEKIKFLLQYAILAPSTHNTQPWRIKVEDSSCQIFIDRSRQLPAADRLQRDMYISLGAFLKNLEMAAKAFGVYDRTDIADQTEDLVAEVHFKGLASGQQRVKDQKLLSSIQTRSNYRGPLAPLTISDDLSSFISSQTTKEIKLKLLKDRRQIEELAGLTAKGLKLAYANPAFRREIASWINPNTSRKRAGIPGYSLRMPTLASHIIPKLIRFKDLGKKLANLNYQSFVTASAVVVISADREEPKIWLSIGQATQEIFLHLESRGATASIYVAAVEMGELAESVKKVADLTGKLKPQFLFCIGKPVWPKVYSPREPLKSKLIS
jgi:hypothetical protein